MKVALIPHVGTENNNILEYTTGKYLELLPAIFIQSNKRTSTTETFKKNLVERYVSSNLCTIMPRRWNTHALYF